jgi:hypothetical protein
MLYNKEESLFSSVSDLQLSVNIYNHFVCLNFFYLLVFLCVFTFSVSVSSTFCAWSFLLPVWWIWSNFFELLMFWGYLLCLLGCGDVYLRMLWMASKKVTWIECKRRIFEEICSFQQDTTSKNQYKFINPHKFCKVTKNPLTTLKYSTK